MKLVQRNFLLTGGIIFVVVTMVLTILYYLMPIYYQEVKQGEMEREFGQVVQQLEKQDSERMKQLLTNYAKKNNYLWFSLTDANNHFVYPSLEAEGEQVELQIISPSELSVGDNQSLEDTIQDAKGNRLTLRGEYSLQPVTDASRVLLNLYPLLIVISLTIGGGAAYCYSLTSSRRIKSISQTTRKMTNLSSGEVCQVKGKDEIATLAADINHLYQNLLTSMNALQAEYEKVAESEREKAEFLRMTSHELKTPITSMMGMVDGMIYEIGDFKDRDRYLRKCRELLEEQSQLIQSILDVSRMDMKVSESRESFSLTQLIREILPNYELLATVKGLGFEVSLAEVQLVGNKTYLTKAIKNILDNAFHYTKPAGKIQLELSQDYLRVSNQVQTVLTEQQLKQIFQPFYRPDYSRNRQDGGTGLGLFIVQQVLEKHQLRFEFKSVGEEWMEFRVWF